MYLVWKEKKISDVSLFALFTFSTFITLKTAHKSFSSFCHGLIHFLTALLLLTLYVVSKTYAFTLCFVLSHFSVLCKEGGEQITQQTISQFFCAWRWDLCLWVGSMFGDRICTCGWDLCSGFLSFLAWLFFPHQVFDLEKSSVMSHFLSSWLLS